jgi:hypothetical protein
MARQSSAHARLDTRASDAGIEGAVRAGLAGTRPSLDEILSLWPVGHHDRVVLWARVGADGGLAVGARMRDQPFGTQPPEVAREVRRIRNDVPVVLELDAVGSVVVPMRTLTGR